ncbi:sensor domain-containing phosphodiesterase [Anaerovorax odorimutans]|uniref:Sensor domain-containing phosphodiesterase n=1 Tax=Anaerovorax odorimutans TaxID=109327 RepID=A0ABT1RS92_9FIRM|nr:sensor domain-containing phosphodiesterase [Anaerovorax odorimutans]MCQ4638069.1 sensor domain-containing phosphodiesterase [Anaerovorax odorimutans]
MQKAFEMLDAISELVYIADIETYELLYLNKPGREKFEAGSTEGKKCYELLQGRDHPCEFCTNDRLTHEEVYTWEFYNPSVDGYYILKDSLIDWEGKPARFEVAFEVTELELQKKALERLVRSAGLIIDCAKILHQPESLETIVNKLLDTLGRFLEAERAYIFEIRGTRMDNTYEWCAPGIQPEKDNLQNMDISLVQRWRPSFNRQECVVIEDIGEIRDISPDEYQVLINQNIHSLVAAPLASEGSLLGYIGVDNPPSENIQHIPLIFTTLSYFLTSVIEKQETEKLLRRLSYQDTLTSVHNRNRFIKDVEKLSVSPCRDIGILYVDLNGLKAINDNQGHNYGDLALTNTATKIASVFPHDSIYRVGGDEFVVICGPLSKDDFDSRVWALKKAFINNQEYNAAIGATWSKNCDNIQQLISRADEQMYADKKAYYRKNPQTSRYRYINDHFLELSNPQTLYALLSDGAFPVYFQPKLSFADRHLAGAEALVRYVDKNGTMVSPAQFIPVLESARLIYMLDFYVFRYVCRTLQIWQNEGRTVIPVSVNFSRYTLTQAHFLENLLEIWHSYDIPQNLILIEITEGAESELSSEIVTILKQVKDAGFSISIDDFGVKYANLSLFTSMDFDELKIDKSLVDDVVKNEKAQLLIQTIVELCKKLGINLVAEGVETEDQFDMLHRFACDIAQGYLFSRPLPLDEFIRLYLSRESGL